MSMEEVLDSVRRIIHKWVNTESLISQDIAPGDTVIYISDARRFNQGDDFILINNSGFEVDLSISSTNIENNTITTSSPVLNAWTVSSGTMVKKTIYDQFVQGIYIGDPDSIIKYPAITVMGADKSSEWMTLEASKERYEIEVSVYVQSSTHEKGYRFLQKITDIIALGLKRNITPLVGPYNITSLEENTDFGDVDIKIANSSLVDEHKHVFIEDSNYVQENWVVYVYDEDEDPSQTQIRLKDQLCFCFDKSDTNVIVSQRYFYNSWPSSISYGSIHKGELLKASKISWFAEETESQYLRRTEMKLN